MKVRYIYSACVVIETEDVVIGCDPWFTQGAELGSWYQYPLLIGDPVEILGKCDVLYISHIHDDHYDPAFLRRYLGRHPDTRIIICKFDPDLLGRRMQADGFKYEVVGEKSYGETKVKVIGNGFYSWDVDSALVVVRGDQSVVNLNDNQYDENQVAEILKFCPQRPSLALLPYAGAGPYPQTYHFDDPAERDAAAEKKKRQFLGLYQRYIDELNPEFAMPFAGSYVLAGPLARLNEHRGGSDQTEVLKLEERYSTRSMVLADGGRAYFDLDTRKASALRDKPHDPDEVRRTMESVPFPGYDYEIEFRPKGDKPLPLISLCTRAYEQSIKKTRATEPWWICLKPRKMGRFITFNVLENHGVQVLDDVSHLDPRWEIDIDDRLLFLILSRYHNWNSADAGSHFFSRRCPDRYVPSVGNFLYFFMV